MDEENKEELTDHKKQNSGVKIISLPKSPPMAKQSKHKKGRIVSPKYNTRRKNTRKSQKASRKKNRR